MIDFQVAFDKLASLDCADEIALFLQEQGVKAYKAEPQKCAIAQWITDSTGLDEIYVDSISIDHWISDSEEHQVLGSCTVAMGDFIVAFDDGKYPYLIAEDYHD